jgi:SAM-dependent methyltransferase
MPPLTASAWLRYDLIQRAINRAGDIDDVLEIGVGQGGMGARLAEAFRYTGIELDPDSCRIAAPPIEARGGKVLEGDASALELDVTFDLLCAFEVLEHHEDDVGALLRWRRFLRHDGSIVLSVPAFQRRYGPWDERAGHFRRYERAQLHEILSSAGFHDVAIWTYGFPLGHALELGRHLLAGHDHAVETFDARTRVSGRALQPPGTVGWATWILAAPFRILQRPFVCSEWGIGFVAHARVLA